MSRLLFTGWASAAALLLAASAASAQWNMQPPSQWTVQPMPGSGIFMTSINYPQVYGRWLNVPGGIISGPPLRIETLDGRVAAEGGVESALAPVRVEVNLPAFAQLSFNGVVTPQTGESRSFVSPPVSTSDTAVYDIRARWTENGRPITWRREYTVRGGDRLTVNVASAGVEEIPPPKLHTTELRPSLRLPGTSKPPENPPRP
jgi:uncharacterized protein (TIGR03000 family)